MYLLDLRICTQLLKHPTGAARRRLLSCKPEDIRLCSIVQGELLYAARRARSSALAEENLQLLATFFAPLESLEYCEASAAEYGLMRAEVERRGLSLNPVEVMTCAIARVNDAALVTYDATQTFQRVPGVRFEDWRQYEDG
ncbi:MAG: type II toxin-antitoxin system VapC family toxin [Pseudomonadota bacterium]